MRLLVTNDDGVDSVFLHELVRALTAAGHLVFVVAPKVEQSWTGAAKSRSRPVHAERRECGLGCPTWAVDGTPSDCVNIAISHLLPEEPEAVVSGINVGLNASIGFILGSGTVAGACEGALHGLPGVAVSQCLEPALFDRLKAEGGHPDPELAAMLRVTASHAARLAPELAAQTPRSSFIVHNLNFPYPCRADATLRRTVPARTLMPGLFRPKGDAGHYELAFRLGDDAHAPGVQTDRQALDAGHISHTVLDFSKLGSI